jgi:hypothetical protein
MYFNDARHYYLYAFEPPMTMEDAWRPVDELVETSVDTLIYGVETGGGLFSDTKVGVRAMSQTRPIDSAHYWRAWYNMQSLIDRGLDPLTVLIDRAHDKGMDFIASVRMTAYLGMDRSLVTPEGRGYVHQEIRDAKLAVLKELAHDYPTEGIEMDFSCPPGGGPPALREEDVAEHTSTITDFVRSVADTVHNRPGGPGVVGARIYPTEAMNRRAGYDVRKWIEDGSVDYVVPMMYTYFILDQHMPIDWVLEAAGGTDTSVYGMLQPHLADEGSGAPERVFTSAEHMRAGAMNMWDRGADGLYTFFGDWPHGDAVRRYLTDIGDPDLMVEKTKRYFLAERKTEATDMEYDQAVPVEIPQADPDTQYDIPFYVSDDIEGKPDRIKSVALRMKVDNLMTHDTLSVSVNGTSLADEPMTRDYGHPFGPYAAQQLEFYLHGARPSKGWNCLGVSLDARPENMSGGVTVHDVEIIVEYSSYPSRL